MAGNVLCNACGLFLKLHGRPRPISLKSDVIKSRNRVKSSGQPKKKAGVLFEHLDEVANRAGMGRSHSEQTGANESNGSPSGSPNVFSGLPSMSVSTLPNSSSKLAEGGQGDSTAPQQLCRALQTRVAELELVNDLFRSRVNELETSEANARRSEVQLRLRLEDSQRKERQFISQIREMECQLNAESGERKKMRVADMMDENETHEESL